MKRLLLALLLSGCTGQVLELPPTCEAAPESVRAQLCQDSQPIAIMCTDTATRVPELGECTGPRQLEHAQESGNTWCCRFVARAH